MKKIVEVTYKKLGDDGYYAHLEYEAENERGWKEEEFFSESWKILCDRVLFFCVDLVTEE
jgi:hypothetical protein